MTVKRLLILVFLWGTLCVYSAAPAAPQWNGVINQPLQGSWITNVTWIHTNVAVKGPGVDFQNVIVYAGTNGLHGAILLSWDNKTNEVVTHNFVYYGEATQTQTNVYRILPRISTVAFFGIFKPQTTYWSYVTACNGLLESLPSDVLLFTPSIPSSLP